LWQCSITAAPINAALPQCSIVAVSMVFDIAAMQHTSITSINLIALSIF
jgi:hypothetical protein